MIDSKHWGATYVELAKNEAALAKTIETSDDVGMVMAKDLFGVREIDNIQSLGVFNPSLKAMLFDYTSLHGLIKGAYLLKCDEGQCVV